MYKKKNLKRILQKEEDGFTYIETLVCIAIILLLTLAVGISAVKLIDKGKEATCRKEIDTFKQALEQYYSECGVFPSEAQGLQALWEKPILYPVPNNWDGPYIDGEVPLDPWGNEYYYKVPGTNNLPYEIFTYGSDGEQGGEGSKKDIYSWKRR